MSDEHLTPHTSNRGFTHLPPLPDDYGADDAIRVYESSNIEPSIWLNVKQIWHCDMDENFKIIGPERTVEATVHMSVETAAKLRDQLTYLLENHYQLG